MLWMLSKHSKNGTGIKALLMQSASFMSNVVIDHSAGPSYAWLTLNAIWGVWVQRLQVTVRPKHHWADDAAALIVHSPSVNSSACRRAAFSHHDWSEFWLILWEWRNTGINLQEWADMTNPRENLDLWGKFWADEDDPSQDLVLTDTRPQIIMSRWCFVGLLTWKWGHVTLIVESALSGLTVQFQSQKTHCHLFVLASFLPVHFFHPGVKAK